jgi:glyoxylase-like metal-dependent hydrolase (beta-lactamase superfamily II)
MKQDAMRGMPQMKSLLIAAAVAVLACVPVLAQTPAPPAAPAPPVIDTLKVAEGVYRFRYGGSSAMFVVDPEGVLVTDPVSFYRPETARAYLAEVRKISNAPIRYLVYSHTHYDHASGGQLFKDAGAVVVAHRNAKARLEKVNNNPQLTPVDRGVGDHTILRLGKTKVELTHVGRNHSDNALVIGVPAQKVIFAVDWLGVAPQAIGFNADVWPQEWTEGLSKVLAMDWDKLILGHGGGVVGKAEVQKQLDYMLDGKAAAKTLSEARKCNPAGRAETALPTKYQGFAQPAGWDAALTRWCLYFEQGY